MRPTNEKSTRPGVDSSDSKFTPDYGQCSDPFQSKPEIDLVSWASLADAVKPTRTNRRQKRTWKRGAK